MALAGWSEYLDQPLSWSHYTSMYDASYDSHSELQ